MKKTVTVMLAVALGAFIAQAQTTSDNIVGYVKETVQPGLKISTFQFESGSSLASEVYGDAFDVGSKIYTYNAGSGYGQISTYESYFDLNTFMMVTGWNPDVTLASGQAYWLENAGGSAVEAVVAGEVPDDASKVISIEAGLQLIGFPYPVAVDVENMGFTPSLGDKVYTYNSGSGYGQISTYESYFDLNTFMMVEGWNPSVTIGVGDGVWYEANASFDWTATKPF